MNQPGDAATARIDRLERTVRRQTLLIGVLIGGAGVALLGGAASAPQEMSLSGSTITGVAVDNDVIYRVSASGVVEQIAIGERRAALVELQLADPRRQVPGIRGSPSCSSGPE